MQHSRFSDQKQFVVRLFQYPTNCSLRHDSQEIVQDGPLIALVISRLHVHVIMTDETPFDCVYCTVNVHVVNLFHQKPVLTVLDDRFRFRFRFHRCRIRCIRTCNCRILCQL